MRYRQYFLLIGVACHPQALLARAVQIQDFEHASSRVDSFNLVTAAPATNAPEVDTEPRSIAPDNLSAQFNALGGDAQQPGLQGPPPSPGIRPTVGFRTGEQRAGFARHGPSEQLHTVSAYPTCGAVPYRPNPALRASVERRRLVWYGSMADAACAAGVPVPLFDAVIVQESGYNPTVVSAKGAASLAQLMPGRARMLGVANVWDPVANLAGGARYLRALLDEFGRFDLALAAYNAGENRVRGNLQVPRIKETVNYVSNILTSMREQIARNPY